MIAFPPTTDDTLRPDLPYLWRRVRRQAQRLIGKAGLTPADREDVEQELALRLWQALPGYNPDMGKCGAFVGTVLQRAAHSLLRLRTSRKRGGHCRHQSLPAPGAGVELPESLVAYLARDGRADLDMACDLATVLERLPPRLRELAEALKYHYSVTEIARRMDVSRATVHVRIKALRRVLKKAGLKFRPEFSGRFSRVLRTL